MAANPKKFELAGVPEVLHNADGEMYLRVNYLNAKRELRTMDFGPMSLDGAARLVGQLNEAREGR